jgi:cation-transporting P-type ATPase 13A2
MDDPAWKLDDYSLKPLTPPSHHSVDADMVDYQDYALVVTGDVFRWMVNNAPLETVQRVWTFSAISPLEWSSLTQHVV